MLLSRLLNYNYNWVRVSYHSDMCDIQSIGSASKCITVCRYFVTMSSHGTGGSTGRDAFSCFAIRWSAAFCLFLIRN